MNTSCIFFYFVTSKCNWLQHLQWCKKLNYQWNAMKIRKIICIVTSCPTPCYFVVKVSDVIIRSKKTIYVKHFKSYQWLTCRQNQIIVTSTVTAAGYKRIKIISWQMSAKSSGYFVLLVAIRTVASAFGVQFPAVSTDAVWHFFSWTILVYPIYTQEWFLLNCTKCLLRI